MRMRILLICLALSLALSGCYLKKPFSNSEKEHEKAVEKVTEANDSGRLKIYIDDNLLKTDKPPFISEGRTYVPVRDFCDEIGLIVEFDSESKTITMRNNNYNIKAKIHSRTAVVNGDETDLGAQVLSVDGSSYIPAAFVAKTIGYNVSFDESAYAVRINKQNSVRIIRRSSQKEEPVTVDDPLGSAVDRIKQQAANLDKEITVEIGDIPPDVLAKEILELNSFYSFKWTSSSIFTKKMFILEPEYTIGQEVLYGIRTGDMDKLSATAVDVYNRAAQLLAEITNDDMSDYDKEVAVHDYLVLHTKYDEAAAEAGYASGDDGLDTSFTAYGSLFNGRGVCRSYSEAFLIMMALAGIECEEVSGVAGGVSHSWNIVKLGESYYHTDVTWDDPTPDRPGEVSHAYLNLTDEQMAKDHTWHDIGKTAEGESYNYFVVNDYVVGSQSGLEKLAARELDDKPDFEFRLEGIDLEDLSFDFLSGLTNARSYVISKTDAQKVYKLVVKNS